MQTVILATSNPGKLLELNALLAPLHCLSQQELSIDSADETGLSFIENALIKARHASRIAHQPALADDSGLVVHALKGSPGIYSARYAGVDANNDEHMGLLLHNMRDIPDDQRQAYFYCAMAFVQHADDPTPLVVTGKLAGLITKQPVGSHGFGYDPVFYLPQYECTLAELSPDIKNTISHRAEALKQLREQFEPLP
jgi:XTP/dITP diphosphohydrolase